MDVTDVSARAGLSAGGILGFVVPTTEMFFRQRAASRGVVPSRPISSTRLVCLYLPQIAHVGVTGRAPSDPERSLDCPHSLSAPHLVAQTGAAAPISIWRPRRRAVLLRTGSAEWRAMRPKRPVRMPRRS